MSAVEQELHYPITYAGQDWTPLIKQFGEERRWKQVSSYNFPAFQERFRDEPWSSQKHGQNVNGFFVMAYRVLRLLSTAERAQINDWPSLRRLIDAYFLNPDTKRELRRQKRIKRALARAAARKAEEEQQAQRQEQIRASAPVSGTPLGRFRARQKTG